VGNNVSQVGINSRPMSGLCMTWIINWSYCSFCLLFYITSSRVLTSG